MVLYLKLHIGRFLVTTGISFGLGGLLSYYGHETQSFSLRDGFLVVSATWILTIILGSLPLFLVVY